MRDGWVWGLVAVPVGGRTSAKQKSHAIRLGEVSTTSGNVAIPTLWIQGLKQSWGNCMRNWVSVQEWYA